MSRDEEGEFVAPDVVDSLDELARLQLENAVLRAEDEEWRRMVDTMPQIVWITRPDGWHTYFNRQWLEFTGLTLEESLGHGWNPPFHRDDRARAAELWEEATRTGSPYQIEYRLRQADGIYHWMLGRAMPLHGADGQIVKWFGTCTDIEDLKQAQARIDEQARLLEQRATMDPLTGLGNRSLLFDRLDFLLAQRHRSGLAVAFLDLDDFKRTNDEHGHASGDQVLVAVADRLRSATRRGDVVARLGGDEFVVLTETPTEAEALELAHRLAAALAGASIPASVGVTFVGPDDPAGSEAIVSRADSAMYGVKRRSRSRRAARE